eukprot:TRINITY_DN3062_c0_g1_i1.p1 TRINITY_DN3062_c0_g1~~TRINITY_DN3062_c0_g1_i1.p1  ORF type:complete len:121 (+),score=15.95 TRINITY_DN3062_c0_g1_i1:2-364(+)
MHPMTATEKRQLCEDISHLPPVHMEEVFKIVIAQMPQFFSNRQITVEHFDIDFDSLSNATIQRIEQFVYSTMRTSRKNSAPPVSQNSPAKKKSVKRKKRTTPRKHIKLSLIHISEPTRPY